MGGHVIPTTLSVRLLWVFFLKAWLDWGNAYTVSTKREAKNTISGICVLADHNWWGHHDADFKQIWAYLQRRQTVLFVFRQWYFLLSYITGLWSHRDKIALHRLDYSTLLGRGFIVAIQPDVKPTCRRFWRWGVKFLLANSVQRNESCEESKHVGELAAVWAVCSWRERETLPGLCQPSAT